MEVHIAANLIEKGVAFRKSDPPDFTIGDTVFLECSSSHKINESLNLFDKVRMVIDSKSKQEYCNPSTAICVDITNLLATTNADEDRLLSLDSRMKNEVIKILKETNSDFGAVLLFFYYMDGEGIFRSGYWRIDNGNITNDLGDFLDRYYPVGKTNTGGHWRPKAG